MSTGALDLVLSRGQSSVPRVAYGPAVPAMRTLVGAGPGADWVLQAQGVAQQHVELAWDGTRLWARDVGTSQGTFVSGSRLAGDWIELQAGLELALGSAVLAVVLPGATAAAASASADAHGDALDSAGADRTMIVESPYDQQQPAPAARPTLPMAATNPHGAPRIAAVPPPRVTPGALRAVSGATESSESGEATMAISLPEDDRSAPSTSPGTFAPPVVSGSTTATPNNPFAAQTAAGSAGDGFDGVPSIFGSIPMPPPAAPPAAAAGLRALPRRTQILAGITALAVIVMLVSLLRKKPEPEETFLTLTTGAGLPPVRHNLTAPIAGPPAGPTGTLLATSTGIGAGSDAGVLDPVAAQQSPERRAADALVQGQLGNAVALYDQLAAAHTETPVYAQIAQILRRKNEAREAQQPCPPGSPTPCPMSPAAPVHP